MNTISCMVCGKPCDGLFCGHCDANQTKDLLPFAALRERLERIEKMLEALIAESVKP